MLNSNELENELNEALTENENNQSSNEGDSSLLDEDLLQGEGIVDLSEIRDKQKNKEKINKILMIILVIVSLLFVGVFLVYYFFNLVASDKKITGYDKDYVDFVGENILNSSNNNLLLAGSDEVKCNKIKSYLADTSIFFYNKQENIAKIIKQEKGNINTKLGNLKKVKDILVKYRYLPKELNDILKDIKIMPILLTLNSIKLYITDYVYIKLGTFDESILDYVKKYNPSYSSLDSKLNGQLGKMIKSDIINLRELGVKTYLNDVVFNYMYVNPLKYGKQDKFANNYFINNFYENYKDIINQRYKIAKKYYSSLNKDEFVSQYIMILADVYSRTNDLFENKDIISLPVDIKLLSYEPSTQTLAFNVKLSIKEGESKLSVFNLATNVITALRESRLIIGKDINFDKIKVNKVVSRTVDGKKVYDTISLVFKTSVQNSVNVEVTDSYLGK